MFLRFTHVYIFHKPNEPLSLRFWSSCVHLTKKVKRQIYVFPYAFHLTLIGTSKSHKDKPTKLKHMLNCRVDKNSRLDACVEHRQKKNLQSFARASRVSKFFRHFHFIFSTFVHQFFCFRDVRRCSSERKRWFCFYDTFLDYSRVLKNLRVFFTDIKH
jgi:hypothetical protein